MFSFDPDRFLSFLYKTKPSSEIYLVMHECVLFRFKLIPRQAILSSNVPRERSSVFVLIRPYCYKRLRCNANI